MPADEAFIAAGLNALAAAAVTLDSDDVEERVGAGDAGGGAGAAAYHAAVMSLSYMSITVSSAKGSTMFMCVLIPMKKKGVEKRR